MDALTGKQLALKSRMNPQTQYGADVIMRADHALEHGVEQLTGCIRNAVDEMLQELAEEAGRSTVAVFLVDEVSGVAAPVPVHDVDVDPFLMLAGKLEEVIAVSCAVVLDVLRFRALPVLELSLGILFDKEGWRLGEEIIPVWALLFGEPVPPVVDVA